MKIINITHVKHSILMTLKSGIFFALLLSNLCYADIITVENSQEFISSDSRENETSKDE